MASQARLYILFELALATSVCFAPPPGTAEDYRLHDRARVLFESTNRESARETIQSIKDPDVLTEVMRLAREPHSPWFARPNPLMLLREESRRAQAFDRELFALAEKHFDSLTPDAEQLLRWTSLYAKPETFMGEGATPNQISQSAQEKTTQWVERAYKLYCADCRGAQYERVTGFISYWLEHSPNGVARDYSSFIERHLPMDVAARLEALSSIIAHPEAPDDLVKTAIAEQVPLLRRLNSSEKWISWANHELLKNHAVQAETYGSDFLHSQPTARQVSEFMRAHLASHPGAPEKLWRAWQDFAVKKWAPTIKDRAQLEEIVRELIRLSDNEPSVAHRERLRDTTDLLAGARRDLYVWKSKVEAWVRACSR